MPLENVDNHGRLAPSAGIRARVYQLVAGICIRAKSLRETSGEKIAPLCARGVVVCCRHHSARAHVDHHELKHPC